MALSATISLRDSSVQINQPTVAFLTVSNSGGSPVNIVACQPTVVLGDNSPALDKSSFSAGGPVLSQIANVTVPASGTLALQFELCVFEPSLTSPSVVAYDVGANFQASDGTYFSVASPADLTVTQVNFLDAAPGFPTNP